MENAGTSTYRGHRITTRCESAGPALFGSGRFKASFHVKSTLTCADPWQAFPQRTFTTPSAAMANARVVAMESIDFEMSGAEH